VRQREPRLPTAPGLSVSGVRRVIGQRPLYGRTACLPGKRRGLGRDAAQRGIRASWCDQWQSGLMSKNFPVDFYVTCATVIPVLFLAAAIQGNAYTNVLGAAMKAAETEPGATRGTKAYAFARSRLLRLIGYWIWCAGAIGEFLALLALYQGHEDSGSRLMVFLSTILLVVAVAAGPLDSYLKLRASMRDGRPSSVTSPPQDATQQPM
jgi:hypothetical protein